MICGSTTGRLNCAATVVPPEAPQQSLGASHGAFALDYKRFCKHIAQTTFLCGGMYFQMSTYSHIRGLFIPCFVVVMPAQQL